MMRLLRWLRFEEVVFGGFLVIMLALCLVESRWLVHFYADRLTHACAIVMLLLGTIRINWRLWRCERVSLAWLGGEVSPTVTLFRDWFGLFMCWSMYGSIASLMAQSEIRDAWLIAADRALVGIDVSVWMERFISVPLTTFMVVVYAGFFVYMPLLIGWFSSWGMRRALREYLLALIFACFFGYLGYTLVPAIGPMFAQRDLYSVDIWKNPAARAAQGVLQFIDSNRIKRDCFPSMHSCLSVLSLLFAWRWERRLFWGMLPFVLGLLVSTLYLRYHYLVDVIAGVALAWGSFRAAAPLLDFWLRQTGRQEAEL